MSSPSSSEVGSSRALFSCGDEGQVLCALSRLARLPSVESLRSGFILLRTGVLVPVEASELGSPWRECEEPILGVGVGVGVGVGGDVIGSEGKSEAVYLSMPLPEGYTIRRIYDLETSTTGPSTGTRIPSSDAGRVEYI
jgi:hypothetical protein